jgi:hypothetical protein
MNRQFVWNRLSLVLSAILLWATQMPVVPLSLGQDVAPKFWPTLDAGQFSISAPLGWQFHKLQGIDSYVGTFEGDGVRLDFDFGAYSNSLDEAKVSTYLISYEYIGGFRAKIVCPRKSGQGVTGVYFSNLGQHNKLTVEGRNLNTAQQDLVLTMFRRIRFR